MHPILKKSIPYVSAVLLFIAISFVYFSPVLEDKSLPQMDNTHAVGMAKELKDFQQSTGEKSMWTNSMFGGMPAYQIKADASTNIYYYLNKVTRLGLPFHTVAILFLYLLGFYILLLSLRIDPWLSMVGAAAFAFGSFNFIIIIAGHITQAYAIALMAPVLAGVLFIFNRNKWLGGLLTAVAMGMEISYNHIQITYYLGFLILVVLIAKAIDAYKEKDFKTYGIKSAIFGVAMVLAILPNITNLWTTYEYGKVTNRGTSEIKTEGKAHSGLDKDYALAWSYGVQETWTLMIPNVVGGSSIALGENPEVLENCNDEQIKEFIAGQSQYWGGRSFTSGPVYAGAIICFLFILGMFINKGKEKWWILGAFILSIFLAWGKNFPFFTDIMFYYFPMYNKFRTVEMALVIASLVMPLLAILTLKEIVDRPEVIKQKAVWFLTAVGLTGGISLLFYAFPTAFFDFMDPRELEALTQQKVSNPQMASAIDMAIEQLRQARILLLQPDALKSAVFIFIASASIWFYATGKLGARWMIGGIAMLILIDLWAVDKRYLNNDKFESTSIEQQFTMSKADQSILRDNDPNYRVFSIYLNPFTEVNTSYYHKSIGGYHGAKLRRYQDVIDAYLAESHQGFMPVLKSAQSEDDVVDYIKTQTVLNMLNTKYIIYNPQAEPLQNPSAMGNAWFVANVDKKSTPDDELKALGTLDIANEAVVSAKADGLKSSYTAGGTIKLEDYKPNSLKYRAHSTGEGFAVFSEIYYAKGWNAYVDGKLTPHYQTNYILRGMEIPAGDHVVEFKFEPTSYSAGKIIALLASLLVLGAFVAWYYISTKKCKKE